MEYTFVSILLTHSSHESVGRLLTNVQATVCSAVITLLVLEQLAPPTDRRYTHYDTYRQVTSMAWYPETNN